MEQLTVFLTFPLGLLIPNHSVIQDAVPALNDAFPSARKRMFFLQRSSFWQPLLLRDDNPIGRLWLKPACPRRWHGLCIHAYMHTWLVKSELAYLEG